MATRFPIAVALWGLAIGIVAYRYGMLPFAWSSPLRHVVPGLAIGLAFGGRQLWKEARDQGVARPGVAPLAAAGLTGAALAFGIGYVAFPTLDRAELTKREMQGFDLSLPSGEVVQEQGDYTAGKLVVKHAGGAAVVAVQWEPGTPFEPGDLETIAKLLGGALGARGEGTMTTVRGPDGAPVDSIAIEGDMQFVMSLLRCGVRHVMVATVARRSVATLHQRIVKTFVCRADAARDATARMDVPLHIDLPGWWVESREAEQLVVTNGDAVLMMRPMLSTDVPIEKLLNQSFAVGGVAFELGARDGTRIALKINADGETVHGWAEMFTCQKRAAVLLGLVPDPSDVDALHRRVKEHTRCLRDGEPPQQWPDAASADVPAPATGSATTAKP